MGSQGIGTLDFGAFPGGSDASLAITGEAGIVSGSLVEAWLRPAATADHTADEHLVETIKVMAGNIVAGVGFTIYGVNTSQLNEPVENVPSGESWEMATASTVVRKLTQHGRIGARGGGGTRIYGVWSVAWVWN